MTYSHLSASFTMAGQFVETIGRLNAGDSTPLYLQLQSLLRTAIHNRVLRPDMALPPERKLAEDYSVSRITVRMAVEGLVTEGLLVKRRGAGTFVTQRIEKSLSQLSSFSEEMIARGRLPQSRWLAKSMGIVTPEESLSLGLSPSSQVCRFQRLRYADGQVLSLEFTTVPAFCLPTLEDIGNSLYQALETTGHRPVRALQRLRAVALTIDQADKLGLEPGAPGLFIERRGYLADGRACELNHSYYRADAYDVVAEVSNPIRN